MHPPLYLFSTVAVFVLGTTRKFQRVSSFESRIRPIVETWGSLFPHLYFVFGTNVFDQTFLSESCQFISRYGDVSLESETGGGARNTHRNLYASAPQTTPVNASDLYKCPSNVNVLRGEPVAYKYKS